VKRQRSQKSTVDDDETDLSGGVHQVPPFLNSRHSALH
jgi:hypothetical protein